MRELTKNQLIINRLSQAQYDAAKAAGELHSDELYITPGETSEKFIVNLTFKSQEVVGVSDVSMDKTVQEIVAAYRANKEIIIYADGEASGATVSHLKTTLPLTQIVDAEENDGLVLGFSNLFYMQELVALWNLSIIDSDSEDTHEYNFTINKLELESV